MICAGRWIAAALLLGCAGAPPAPRAPSQPPTRYRVGDRIVYRYTGEALAAPVDLEERIVARDGARLRIAVTATRGGEVLRWVQVVTDTPENRAANRVDELYLVADDGREERLPNENNADLLRLYAWTLPAIEAVPTRTISETTQRLSFAGREWTCRVTEQALDGAGDDARMRTSECDELVWTHGPASLTVGGETLWSVDVVEVSRPPVER